MPRRCGIGVIAGTLFVASCASESDTGPAEYVGADACVQCHEEEGRAWTDSHHDRAMEVATPATVLGDFGDRTLVSGRDTADFLRDGERFLIRTEGPDGSREMFEVAYTFGLSPLQQYLIRLPGGRLQAYTGAWDSRPDEAGGQRWFPLYPGDEAAHGGDLHWARPTQTWNTGCAPCHSTGLVNTYDAERDSFDTSYSDEDVSCEACHGPGSLHTSAAQQGRSVPMPNPLRGEPGAWVRTPGAATAHREPQLLRRAELDTCAPCHSRRGQTTLAPQPGDPLLAGYEPALLREGLYHPDGQIDGEVYVYGSFLQSRMFAAGVTCGDCHEPHSLSLRAPGNALCTRCHSNEAFDTPDHHLHEPGSAGSECVSCHMPSKTYMGVDPRRDHSLRIPRPDLSAALDTPNPCETCHDEPPQWAAQALAARYGSRDPSTHFAQAIHGGRRGDPAAFGPLATLASDSSRPAILRGSALSLMGRYPRSVVPEALREGLRDPEPLVRLGALDGLRSQVPQGNQALQTLAPLVTPLLDDSLRSLRIRAAEILAPLLASQPTGAFGEGGARAWPEVESAHAANAGRSDAWVRWAATQAALGRVDRAEGALDQALALDSLNPTAWLNLSDLYRARGREDQVARTLALGRALLPGASELQHAEGLHRIRLGDLGGALPLLEAAAQGAPSNARLGYVHAVAVASAGDTVRAVSLLEEVAQDHPFDPDVLAALAGYHSALGRNDRAIPFAERLVDVLPDDVAARRMLDALREGDRSP